VPEYFDCIVRHGVRTCWRFVDYASRQLSEADAARLIREHRLPREVVPTEYLRSAEVWRALLEEMPMTAMLRNLATMTRLGAIGARGNEPDEWARVVIEAAHGRRGDCRRRASTRWACWRRW
jgi:hypothetical protein